MDIDPLAPDGPPLQTPAAVGTPGPLDSPAPPSVPAPLRLPAFIMTFVIMDLVFSCIRIIFGLTGIANSGAIASDNPLHATVPFELTANFGMGSFGIIAAILLLMKRPAGPPLGWVKIVFAILGIIVGVWQLGVMPLPEGGKEEAAMRIGFALGGGVVLIIRVGLLVCYTIAVTRAAKLFKTHREATLQTLASQTQIF